MRLFRIASSAREYLAFWFQDRRPGRNRRRRAVRTVLYLESLEARNAAGTLTGVFTDSGFPTDMPADETVSASLASTGDYGARQISLMEANAASANPGSPPAPTPTVQTVSQGMSNVASASTGTAASDAVFTASMDNLFSDSLISEAPAAPITSGAGPTATSPPASNGGGSSANPQLALPAVSTNAGTPAAAPDDSVAALPPPAAQPPINAPQQSDSAGGSGSGAGSAVLPAATPFQVFGTGLDNSGHILADGAADAHYQIVSGPSAAAPVVLPQTGFPFPYWTADGSSSKWITPGDAVANAGNGYQEPEGDYIYETTFDLTGYDASTATLQGVIGADNTVTQVLINNQDAGYLPTNIGNNFGSLNSLNVTTGFVDGLNKLDFLVHNDPGNSYNPTGFRADLSGTAQMTGTSFGVLSTGVDNSGNPLADGEADPHYQLVSAPTPDAAGASYVTMQNGYPFGHWTDDGANSKWISPHANENDFAGGANDPVGNYTYETTFDLTGYTASTAHISGLVSADNTLEQVLLNGHDIGYTPDPSGTDYTTMHPLDINSGFQSGVNTLDFVVYNAVIDPNNLSDNAHNPSSFRAELTGTAVFHPTTAVVQAPFTWTQPLSPIITSTSDQTNAEGDPILLQVTAIDPNVSGSYPNGYPLSYDAVSLPAGLTINHSTGLISGSVSYSAAEAFGGVYPITVVVADSGGASASEAFNWTVTDVIRPPVLTPVSDQTNTVGDPVNIQVDAAQPDGDQLIYDASDLPDGLSIDSGSGFISGRLADDAASSVVTVTATDQGQTASESFNWTVNTIHAPTLAAPPDQINAAGNAPSLTLAGGDAPGNTLTYSATGLPDGLSIADPSSGVISGTLQNDAASNMPYLVTATVSDGAASVSQSFYWTVNFVGVSNPGDQYNTAGDPVEAPITATDATDVAPTYSAVGLPPGLSIDQDSGVIGGTIAPTAGSANPYAVTVTATDGVNSANTSFAWNVAVPVLSDRSDVEGTPVLFQAPAPTDAAPSYSATHLPNGISIDGGTGRISGKVAVGDAANGPYPVVVTTTYADGSSSSQSFNWTVTPVVTTPPALTDPGSQTSVAGTPVSVNLSVNDPAGGTLDYEEVGLPDGLNLDPDTGVVSGSPAEDAIQSDPQPVTETVTDSFGNSASQTFNWTVTDSTLIVQGNAISTTEGAGGVFTVATFTDADLNRQATVYTATISWGNGQTSDGYVDGTNGSFTVSGDHAFLHPGGLPVQVTVTDPAGGSQTVVETANIAEAPLKITGGFQEGEVNGLSSNLTVAVFSDPNTYDAANSYTATINWGDGATTSGVVDGEDGQFRVTGDHAYTLNGTFTATVTITDGDGTIATATSTVTVGDLYANVAENLTVGAFTIQNLLGSPSTFKATIQWGDGATTLGTLTDSQGNFSVAGTHTYATTEPYIVTVTVTDAKQDTVTASDTVEAVTAPATGYGGEVATTVGTASGATEAVAVDPGGPDNNGDQQDVQETQARGSPGEYAYLIPILSAAGALVTITIPKVEAPVVAKWSGPAVVPGNSKYEYKITFPPIKASEINVDGWKVEVDGGGTGIAQPKTNAAGDWIGFDLTQTFPNKPEIETITLKNLLKGQGGANGDTDIISFKVTVVQVIVNALAAGQPPFTATLGKPFLDSTNKGGFSIDGKSTTGNTTGIIASENFNKNDAIKFQAEVYLKGPPDGPTDTKGIKGVSDITVGFVQHATFQSWQVHFPSAKKSLVATFPMDQKKYLDVVAGQSGPFYDTNADALATGSEAVDGLVITSSDTPAMIFPVIVNGDKAKELNAIWSFQLDVGAATSDAKGQAAIEATAAQWTFNASGSLSAALTYTAAAEAGTKAPNPNKWTVTIVSAMENLNPPFFGKAGFTWVSTPDKPNP